MTFLLTFFKFLFLVLFIGAIGAFGTREMLLFLAGQQVVNDARSLTQSSKWDDLVSLCEGGVVTETPFDGFQLRFTSPTSYNIETHCLATIPGVARTANLPYQVKKTTGSAGFFYDFTSKNLTGELTLELWGQKRIIYAEGSTPGQNWGKSTLQSSVPASVCTAHGFVCCDAVQEIGVDDPIADGVTDCPNRCFGSCQKRPLLLSLNTDPPADYETRQVRIANTEASVIFSFLFDDTQSPIRTVTLHFGDGTTEEILARNGQVTKEYRCAQAPCSYKVKIVGVDDRDIESAQTRLSEMEVLLGVPPRAE